MVLFYNIICIFYFKETEKSIGKFVGTTKSILEISPDSFEVFSLFKTSYFEKQKIAKIPSFVVSEKSHPKVTSCVASDKNLPVSLYHKVRR